MAEFLTSKDLKPLKSDFVLSQFEVDSDRFEAKRAQLTVRRNQLLNGLNVPHDKDSFSKKSASAQSHHHELTNRGVESPRTTELLDDWRAFQKGGLSAPDFDAKHYGQEYQQFLYLVRDLDYISAEAERNVVARHKANSPPKTEQPQQQAAQQQTPETGEVSEEATKVLDRALAELPATGHLPEPAPASRGGDTTARRRKSTSTDNRASDSSRSAPLQEGVSNSLITLGGISAVIGGLSMAADAAAAHEPAEPGEPAKPKPGWKRVSLAVLGIGAAVVGGVVLTKPDMAKSWAEMVGKQFGRGGQLGI